jgi:predicted RNase H-like HicB family nuclease
MHPTEDTEMPGPKRLWQVPPQALTQYCKAAIERARLERLDDDSWYAEIPGFPGVWANEATPEQCRQVLREVLEEWLALKLEDADDDIPVLAGINLASSAS